MIHHETSTVAQQAAKINTKGPKQEQLPSAASCMRPIGQLSQRSSIGDPGGEWEDGDGGQREAAGAQLVMCCPLRIGYCAAREEETAIRPQPIMSHMICAQWGNGRGTRRHSMHKRGKVGVSKLHSTQKTSHKEQKHKNARGRQSTKYC